MSRRRRCRCVRLIALASCAAAALGLPYLSGCAAPAPGPRVPDETSAPRPGILAGAPAVLAVEPWSYNGRDGRVIRTPHYRVYTTETDAVLISRLPVFLELALSHYRTALGPLPPPPVRSEPLDTFVLSSRADWERLTRQLLGEHAAPYLAIQRGGYAWGGRSVLFNMGTQDTMAIAAHEGWHQYTQRTFREQLPVWLEEGIAAYMEGYRWTHGPAEHGMTPVFRGWANVERFDQLRHAAARGRIVPLSELLAARPRALLEGGADGTLTYYAQVWALVHFLREGSGGRYRPAMERLIADAAGGTMSRAVAAAFGEGDPGRTLRLGSGPAVFAAYFGPDLDTVSREYDAFVRELVRTGSRGAVVEGESPLPPPAGARPPHQ